MKVPQPLESLFNIFPLVKYPAEVRDSQSCLAKFHFVSKRLSRSLRLFILGVHRLRQVQVRHFRVFLPTDPAGLACALILSHKHGLAMPRGNELPHPTTTTKEGHKNNETANRVKPQSQKPGLANQSDHNREQAPPEPTFSPEYPSEHSIVPLSYLAAPDNQLPILIEMSGSNTKCLTTSSQIVDAVALKAGSAIDHTVNAFLDNLQVLWVFTVLQELSFSGTLLLLVFSTRPESGFESGFKSEFPAPLPCLDSFKLVQDMQGWCSFKEKYSHLYASQIESVQKPRSVVKHVLLGPQTPTDTFKRAYDTEVAEFFSFLPLAAEYIRDKDAGESRCILEIKLAAFLLTSVYFLPENSVIRSILARDHAELVEWSIDILIKYYIGLEEGIEDST